MSGARQTVAVVSLTLPFELQHNQHTAERPAGEPHKETINTLLMMVDVELIRNERAWRGGGRLMPEGGPLSLINLLFALPYLVMYLLPLHSVW